ncbi:MAG TPA: cobalamin biosynthesis protein CobD [Anaerolineae bacterium]|nr:cobalamin biosynthesis protein CobD [Anaerolineae bacterium]
MLKRITVILLALLLDQFLGDPPNRWHPVAWMGRGIAWSQRHAPGGGEAPARQLAYGGAIVLVGVSLAATAGVLLARLARSLAWPGIVVEALALKATFSLRGLIRAARQVETALLAHDLPSARRWLSWHLVSRSTEELDASQVAAATIESVAENLSDGVLAPLTWYTIGGLPAAWAYRFLNTADAMLGYRDPAREWLGKIPARADDLANLLPARLTALFIILAAPLAGGNVCRAWRIWRRDARKTTSPNAGHPMSAMAGALGVRLEKSGHYVLGDELAAPIPSDIERAIHLVHLGLPYP